MSARQCHRSAALRRALAVWTAVIVAFGLIFDQSPTGAAAATPGLERWGFYVAYDPASRQSLLDHISSLDVVVPNYFSLLSTGVVSGTGDRVVDNTVSLAQKANLPLIQNRVTGSLLSPFLVDPDKRGSVVNAIALCVVAGGYSGATLDFEGVSSSDRPAFSEFVGSLALVLHQHGKLLAVAVPAATSDSLSGWSSAYDYSAIGAAADRVIVMAYSYRTEQGQPGPISPLPWVESAGAFAASIIPRDKIVLGVGAWGYDWSVNPSGPATALSYDQTARVMATNTGQLTFDTADASAEFRYQSGPAVHQIWFETATTIASKITLADESRFRGVALWRLGQEDPALWSAIDAGSGADFSIPGGWFFPEAGGGTGLGYRVYDDSIRFWTEFKRLGGIATLGYPASRRYLGADGFTYQVFQRGILQWRPELGVAFLANTFDQLSAAGQDRQLAQQGIPLPVDNDGSGGNWQLARQIRLGWLTQSDIARAFYARPGPNTTTSWTVDDAIQLYGLPSSLPSRSGPFVVQRFQRVSLQLWLDVVPDMPSPGTVVGILGGDLVKNAGIVPAAALEPEGPSA